MPFHPLIAHRRLALRVRLMLALGAPLALGACAYSQTSTSPHALPTPYLKATPAPNLARVRPSSSSERGVPRAECFPVEGLRPELRAKAETLLLHACDREALYTIVGGIKPMSSGWYSLSFSLDKPDAKKVDEMRQIVGALCCGDELSAHLYTYAKTYDRQVMLEGALFSRSALRKMIAQRQSFWNGFAITPHTEPLAVLLPTEHAGVASRYRGYGYLFGYPKHAVNFFVRASQQQDTDPSNKLVPRDFLSIPTFERESHAFVYAVPKGQAPNAEDLSLRAKCAPILAEYKRRRAQYIGPGKAGIVALLRDWFDNGKGRCSPSFAHFAGSRT